MAGRSGRAKRRLMRYLTPIERGGVIIGYRFAPGPHLRAKGVVSRILRRADGAYMTLDEASAARDLAIAAELAPDQFQQPG